MNKFCSSTATEKLVKVVGKVQYMNVTTNEVEDFQVVNKEVRDFNFHKIWLEHVLTTFDIIGNQKTKIALYIIDNLNSDNQFIGTVKNIAEKMNCSPETVRQTLNALLENDFLRKIQNGVYMVNPNMIFKGSHNGRMNVLIRYTDTTKTKNQFKKFNEEVKTKSVDEGG